MSAFFKKRQKERNCILLRRLIFNFSNFRRFLLLRPLLGYLFKTILFYYLLLLDALLFEDLEDLRLHLAAIFLICFFRIFYCHDERHIRLIYGVHIMDHIILI